jgi:hypothetical protein
MLLDNDGIPDLLSVRRCRPDEGVRISLLSTTPINIVREQ